MRRKIRFSLDDKLLIRNIPLPMFNNVNKSLSLSNKIFRLNTNSNQKEDDDKQITSSQPYYVTEPSASCSSSKNMLLLPLVNKMYQNSFQYSVEEPEDDEELPSSQYINQFWILSLNLRNSEISPTSFTYLTLAPLMNLTSIISLSWIIILGPFILKFVPLLICEFSKLALIRLDLQILISTK